MLSSAAIATAAALGMKDSDFDINELVRRLQIHTRVDYVSILCHLRLLHTLDIKTCIVKLGLPGHLFVFDYYPLGPPGHLY